MSDRYVVSLLEFPVCGVHIAVTICVKVYGIHQRSDDGEILPGKVKNSFPETSVLIPYISLDDFLIASDEKVGTGNNIRMNN